MSREGALALVEDFKKLTMPGKFKKFDRAVVAEQVRKRVEDPFKINQGTAGVCAPAATAFAIARSDPEQYAKAVTQLFNLGFAIIAKWQIKPDAELLELPCPQGIEQADWILLASIRDSENWFFDYHNTKDEHGDGTTSPEVVKWMKLAGFREIKDDQIATNLFDKTENLKTSLDLYTNKGFHVVWSVSAAMINSGIPNSIPSGGDHVICLAGDWQPPASKSEKVSIPIFTWGRKTTLPEKGGLTYGQFLDQYFGYTAAKM